MNPSRSSMSVPNVSTISIIVFLYRTMVRSFPGFWLSYSQAFWNFHVLAVDKSMCVLTVLFFGTYMSCSDLSHISRDIPFW